MIKGALLTTANILSKPLYQGNLINNRYEIIEFLGRGSYGNSYLVFDREKERGGSGCGACGPRV
jgi:serine/threonine-protein kinase